MLAASMIFETVVQRLASRDSDVNPYGYTPNFGVCILFIALFIGSATAHLFQALHKHTKYMIWSAMVGCLLEALGWFGRAWSSKNVLHKTPFIIQILSTFIAPTFIAAANFIILGDIIQELGPAYSRLAPRRYAQIFVSIDVVALLVQALGGAVASSAVLNNKSAAKGSHIMLLGIFVGFIEIIIYVSLAADFFYNYAHRKVVKPSALPKSQVLMDERGPQSRNRRSRRDPAFDGLSDSDGLQSGRGTMTRAVKALSFALIFSTLALFLRALYRAVALAAGFSSKINHTQILFDLLDGMMIILASGALNIFHPGYLLA